MISGLVTAHVLSCLTIFCAGDTFLFWKTSSGTNKFSKETAGWFQYIKAPLFFNIKELFLPKPKLKEGDVLVQNMKHMRSKLEKLKQRASAFVHVADLSRKIRHTMLRREWYV